MATPNDELRKKLAKWSERADGEIHHSLKTPEAVDAKEEESAPPLAPELPVLEAVSDSELRVTWGVAEASPPARLFAVDYGYKYTGGWNTATEEALDGTVGTVLSGLDAGTRYIARVRARGSAKGAWGPWSSTSYAVYTMTAAECEKAKVDRAAREAEEAAKREEDMAKKVEESKRLVDERKRSKEAARIRDLERQLERQKQAAAAMELKYHAAESKAAEDAKVYSADVEAAKKAALTARADAEAARKLHVEEVRARSAEREENAARIARLKDKAAASEAEVGKTSERLAQAEREARETEAALADKAVVEAEREELLRKLAEREEAVRQAQESAERAQASADKAHGLVEEEVARRAAAEEKASAEKAALHEQLTALEAATAAAEAKEVEREATLAALHADIEATRKSLEDTDMVREERARLQAELETARQREAELRAQAESGKTAAIEASETIISQQERVRQMAMMNRFKDALIRSLQGPGPSPKVETQLVNKGHKRENVRFFMEVFGVDEAHLTRLLTRLNELADLGHREDGIREALVVCKEDDSESLMRYLEEYDVKMRQIFGDEASLMAASTDSVTI